MRKQLELLSAEEIIKNAYVIYGRYVNNHRHIPYVFDGLKPVYKRTILSALAYKGLTKTAAVAGHCIANYHPHGQGGPVEVINQLVNVGILRGQGNFGRQMLLGPDAQAAAERYTNLEINPGYRKLFSEILPYVPTFQNDFGNTEAMYIPFPLPMSLIFGCIGIGIGVGAKIPAFSAKSLLAAYIADDYHKLKSTYGYEIVKPRDLKSLWEGDSGIIRFKMKVTHLPTGAMLEGNPVEYKPNLKELEAWRSAERISIIDVSDKVQRVKFEKFPRLQSPTVEEVFNAVDKASAKSISYCLRTTYNECVYKISMRDWIDITYKNYKGLLEQKRADDIKKAEFDILVFDNFRSIADKILNSKLTYPQIAEKLDLPVDVINAVSTRSINTLRTLDPKDKVKELRQYIKDQKAINFDKTIYDILNNL